MDGEVRGGCVKGSCCSIRPKPFIQSVNWIHESMALLEAFEAMCVPCLGGALSNAQRLCVNGAATRVDKPSTSCLSLSLWTLSCYQSVSIMEHHGLRRIGNMEVQVW